MPFPYIYLYSLNMRQNNFDFLRLCFALFVVISHSFGISIDNTSDWLHQLTNGQISLSYLGVKGFFVISGYLVFQSQQRSKNIFDYFKKRVLRIFPGLFVMLLLTVIFCALVYQGTTGYFNEKSMWTYLPNNLSLYHQHFIIKGVFENNPYPAVINLPLWTIPYEFTCYIILSLLFIVKGKGKSVFVIAALLILLITKLAFYNQVQDLIFLLKAVDLINFTIYFFAGLFLALLKIQSTKHNYIISLIIIAILILSVILKVFDEVQYFTLPVLIILFGLSNTKFISGLGEKIGDMSYGIYIYAFPIQQFLMHYYKLNSIQLIISSVILSVICGYLSWHLVEKRALKFKKADLN